MRFEVMITEMYKSHMIYNGLDVLGLPEFNGLRPMYYACLPAKAGYTFNLRRFTFYVQRSTYICRPEKIRFKAYVPDK
jgi:hypothetical protein